MSRWADSAPFGGQMRRLGADQGGGEDLDRHGTEVEQRLVSVRAGAEVDLGDRGRAVDGQRVDEGGQLDGVAGRDRQRGEQLPSHGPLAGERLHQVLELRVEQGDQRPRHQLGDPASVEWPLFSRPLVEALDQLHLRPGQQRTEQAGDEVCVPVGQVGVHEHEDVAAGDEERLPHRLALAGVGAEVRADLRRPVHDGTGRGRGVVRPVRRVAVDDHDLVDQRDGVDQPVTDPSDDVADGPGFVARRYDEAHPGVALGADQVVERPVVPVSGADAAHVHPVESTGMVATLPTVRQAREIEGMYQK